MWPVMIDDWLSSQSVATMDPAEESGYFRLCMHAAKKEQGLPDNDLQLAVLSRLEGQWYRPSRDRRFRSELTSGQKIKSCFYLKDGRLFNEKVDKNIADFRERQEQRSRGGLARWGKLPDDAQASGEPVLKHEHSMCSNGATHVGSESENSNSLFGKQETPKSNSPTRLKLEFETNFWPQCWLKVGRGQAEKAYIRQRKAGHSGEIICEASTRQGPSIVEAASLRGSSVLHPATWLNQTRFLDEGYASDIPARNGQRPKSKREQELADLEEELNKK